VGESTKLHIFHRIKSDIRSNKFEEHVRSSNALAVHASTHSLNDKQMSK
jgi:hypothetical protein